MNLRLDKYSKYTYYILKGGHMAWEKTYKFKVQGLQKEQIWKVWENVNEWNTWDQDVEFTKLEGSFKEGAQFILKPKGGPQVQLMVTNLKWMKTFTDRAHFLGATMDGIHELHETPEGLEIIHTIRIDGPLSFIWRKLVAENVAHGIPEQTERLLQKARLQK